MGFNYDFGNSQIRMVVSKSIEEYNKIGSSGTSVQSMPIPYYIRCFNTSNGYILANNTSGVNLITKGGKQNLNFDASYVFPEFSARGSQLGAACMSLNNSNPCLIKAIVFAQKWNADKFIYMANAVSKFTHTSSSTYHDGIQTDEVPDGVVDQTNGGSTSILISGYAKTVIMTNIQMDYNNVYFTLNFSMFMVNSYLTNTGAIYGPSLDTT